LPCRIAGKIDENQLTHQLLKDNLIKKSELNSMSMANVYSIVTADEAIKDSGWIPELNEYNLLKAGTSFATGMAGLSEIAQAALQLNKDLKKGYKSMSPYFIPKILPNLSSGLISIRYKLKVSLSKFEFLLL
jgi:3-oxoacyl-[acyl-carrier-protein] synthase II